MTAHLDFFSLSIEPFSKEVDDKDLWLPPSKKSLVDDLVESIEARESVVLTGEPGVGKTCVLRALRHALPTDRFRLTYCHNATLGRRDFYRQLCLALGLSPSATAAAVFYAVAQHVEDLARDRRAHPVFLLDEAHLLHQDTLDHLHILLNYEWDSKALLSLVLVGLSDFDDRLRVRRNRSLASRIHRRFVIDPLTPEDTGDYLRARLARAGCNRDVFAADAVTILHEAAGGALRDLDRLATSCLRLATPTTRMPENADESGVVLSETSWIDRLTPEELAGLDDFDRRMLLEELEWRRKRLEHVEKENSTVVAATLLLLNNGRVDVPAGSLDRGGTARKGRRRTPEAPDIPKTAIVNERDLPVFLLPADVAALLRTTVKAVYAKVERGQLAGVVRDRTRILFDRDVLLRSLHGRGQ